ncbi:MAG: hypothetical protein EXS30_09265 [Pedosphaera sp.]|nr:hypothetical protein [Pedosphaera sp.]
MNADPKKAQTLISLSVVFLGLVAAFLLDLWGRPEPLVILPLVDVTITNTATVRMSAAELVRTGGDTSGLSCYTCHEKGKPVEVHFDTNNVIVLPQEHNDLVIQHGRNNRNNHCFNCHEAEALDMVKTRDGQRFKLTESTMLCGSCHGPTYRDWETGVHGRTSGHWNRDLGAITRQDCTSCHDPHAPAFPSIKPGPGPQPLHPRASATKGPH